MAVMITSSASPNAFPNLSRRSWVRENRCGWKTTRSFFFPRNSWPPQGLGDRRGMVGVIVHHGGALVGALDLETALGAVETG